MINSSFSSSMVPMGSLKFSLTLLKSEFEYSSLQYFQINMQMRVKFQVRTISGIVLRIRIIRLSEVSLHSNKETIVFRHLYLRIANFPGCRLMRYYCCGSDSVPLSFLPSSFIFFFSLAVQGLLQSKILLSSLRTLTANSRNLELPIAV